MIIYILDGSEMITREATYNYLSNIMRLPDYFGNNLDALYDELTMLNKNYIIILQNSQAIIDNLGVYGEKLIRVFENGQLEGEFTFIKK